jgi:hypothetical protein
MTERDPEQLSEELEREADALKRQGQEVKDMVEETRGDWERKRQDDGVPGAPPPDGDASEGSSRADDG